MYLGGGAWAPADGVGPDSVQAQSGGHRRVVWPVRVVLSLPLVWGAAVSAGLGVYLLVLAFTVGDPGLSAAWLVVGAAGAFAIATMSMLACGLLLRERPCCRLGLVLLAALVAALLIIVVAAFAGPGGLPLFGGIILVAYAAVVLGLFWLASRSDPRSAGGGASRLLPGRPPHAGGRSGALWAARWLGAAAALAVALAVSFVAFSLWAAAFVSGQPELGWDETLWSAAMDGGAGARLYHAITLILTCLGSAAAFGLLVWAAARALGRWSGRISFWWAVSMGALVVLGVILWLVDGTLPRG